MGSRRWLDERVESRGDASVAASAQRRLSGICSTFSFVLSLSLVVQLLPPLLELKHLSVGIWGLKANKHTL